MLKYLFFFSIVLLLISCNNKKRHLRIRTSSHNINLLQKKSPLSEEEEKNWHFKDIENDTLPGISLERAYNTILKNRKRKEVIIAVLDSEINIKHFEENIWLNQKEIANNNIDDDANGYIDDTNGWNFIANSKGESITNANYEYVRIVREYDNLFKNKIESEIKKENHSNYLKYKKAKIKYKSVYTIMKNRLKNGEKILQDFLYAKQALKDYFPNGNYTYEKLNKIDTIGNGLSKHITEIKLLLDYNDSENNMKRVLNDTKKDINYRLNLNYNPRSILGTGFDNINDFSYGNNRIFLKENNYTHGTRMVSIVLNKVNNQSEKLIVIPVIVEPHGDAHDKDIASGIRYAVDNGAKVINLSFGKEFSLYTKLVHNAIKYAEEHNVLIISSSGNDGRKLDNNFQQHPNDNSLKDKKEISDNFILVGASTINLNKKLKANYSNYSNQYVDFFAPGDNIFTTFPDNEKILDKGTSISAALTSKVAGLIFSYYPNLTASQVKHILMDSGLEYTFQVSTPTKEDKKKTTPFNQLSKSGKVLNAYNALIMADSISRN